MKESLFIGTAPGQQSDHDQINGSSSNDAAGTAIRSRSDNDLIGNQDHKKLSGAVKGYSLVGIPHRKITAIRSRSDQQ